MDNRIEYLTSKTGFVIFSGESDMQPTRKRKLSGAEKQKSKKNEA